MSHNVTIQGAELVPIRGLKPYPGNARRGNIDAIVDSLTHHGQYRPIVITQDNVILAGHHVVQAAKRLGWKAVAAVQVDVTDQQAARIVIADNRIADLASYDESALLHLIENLPDLDGTGFGPADIAQLDQIIDGDLPAPEPGTPKDPDPLSPTVALQLGPLYSCELSREGYDAWLDTYFAHDSKGVITSTIKDWLGIPKPPKPATHAAHWPTEGFTTIPVTDIQCHPTNPREGDIGQLAESLRINGQYRPIVANKTTRHIVVGNHTYLAARSLGWTSIAVQWITVDPDEETKILLVDNRTSDLANYDETALKALLTDILDHTGTGYTPEDIADLMTGGRPKPGPPPTGQTSMRVGDHAWRTPTDLYDQWADGLDLPTILDRLHLDPTTAH